MPIRINLLAEQQAAEEQRRRDPVKRAVWIGGFCVALTLLWAAWLQTKVLAANAALAAEEARLKTVEREASGVAEKLRKTGEIEKKLAALQALATNRFLWASTLNALQKAVVEGVHVVRIRGDQTYAQEAAQAPPKTPADGKPKAGKPATARERILLTIEAKDYANPSELNHNKFMLAISSTPLFQAELRKVDGVTLKDRLPPQPDPADPSRNFILFSVECRYPEKERTL
jgi:hypothetical protein